jgi:hypothetical protein
MEQATQPPRKTKIRATLQGAFTLEFKHDTSIAATLGPDGIKTKVHHALMGDNVEDGPRRAIFTLGEWWKGGEVTLVFYEQDRLDVLDRLHLLGIRPKPIKHGEKVAAIASVITDMLGSLVTDTGGKVTRASGRKDVETIVANVLANMIGEDDVAELRGDRLEAAANVLDCDMGGTAVADAAQKLRQEWAGLNAQVLDVQATLNAEGITGPIGDGVQQLRQRMVDVEQERNDAEELGRVLISERDDARRQRDEIAVISDLRDRLLRGRGAMLDQMEAVREAASHVRNGNGVRSTAEYIRWLLQHHPQLLAADEATSHADRLDEVAQAMDGIGLALGQLQRGEESEPERRALQGAALLVDSVSMQRDEWKGLFLQSLALAVYGHAQWSRMADLWRRAVTEVAAMRLALEVQERAEWVSISDDEAAAYRREAKDLRQRILSTSRPFMSAVPLSWVRHVLMHGYPGITGDMVNDVIRDLERAMADGKPPAVSRHPGAYWVRVCPDCHHAAHQPGQCQDKVFIFELGNANTIGATGFQPCPCQTRVTL